MVLDIVDFPSDPDGQTGDLRRVLLKQLRNAETYPRKRKLIKAIIKFAMMQLTEIQKSQTTKEK